ncbi:MAG: hypothetical protein ACT4O2_10815 [Beijerinckiaceae bacterium]
MTAKVLIVDDLAANLKLLEARLSAEYFEVLTAANGPDAPIGRSTSQNGAAAIGFRSIARGIERELHCAPKLWGPTESSQNFSERGPPHLRLQRQRGKFAENCG